MAISNIFNEPRREIIESAIGACAVGGILALPIALGRLLIWLVPPPKESFAEEWAAASLISAVGLIALLALVFFIHVTGELICDALEGRGIHLRPRDRGR